MHKGFSVCVHTLDRANFARIPTQCYLLPPQKKRSRLPKGRVICIPVFAACCSYLCTLCGMEGKEQFNTSSVTGKRSLLSLKAALLYKWCTFVDLRCCVCASLVVQSIQTHEGVCGVCSAVKMCTTIGFGLHTAVRLHLTKHGTGVVF